MVPRHKNKERLDAFLVRELPQVSRSKIQKLIKEEAVTVDKKAVKANHVVQPEEIIDVFIPKPPQKEIIPEKIPLHIVYEDEFLIVVNKKAGMVVHPAFGHSQGTLVNALLGYNTSLSDINSIQRPGIVHRLDKDTSGLLVVAKNDFIHQELARQFKEKSVGRIYEAVVWGNLKKNSGTVTTQLARNKKDRKKISVSEEGKNAVTHFSVLETFPFASLLKLKLETGRTHQIRVHLSHLGHPVFGDHTYGGRGRQLGGLNRERIIIAKELLTMMTRQALHARTLEFKHPETHKIMQFDSQLPDDMQALIGRLREIKEDFSVIR